MISFSFFVAICIGLAWAYYQGVFDRFTERKAVGVVEKLTESHPGDKVAIFTLIGDDGARYELGMEYLNFDFKNGDRVEAVFYYEPTYKYGVKWHKVLRYRVLKREDGTEPSRGEPEVTIPENKK